MNPTQNKKRYGRCRICEKFGRLTKEHVPPESAFNDRNFLQYYVDEVNRAEAFQWKAREVRKKGIYLFTLCERCNNKTGQLYGAAYLDFVKAFTGVATPDNANREVEVDLKNFFPARVVKQAVSMILSTSNPISSLKGYTGMWNPLLDTTPSSSPKDMFSKMPDPAHLRSVYGELRSFVKKKNVRGLPASVRLYAHVVANKGAGIQTGIFVTGRRSTNKYFWAVVVGLWPIHWVLVLDGELDEDLLEVTDWADLDFKYKRSQKIQVPCKWVVGKYPLDFRSPEVIKRTRFTATMRLEGLVPEPGMNKEQLFQAAISFARRRAKWTREGFLITEFKSGTYFEVEGHQGWLPGVTRDEAREFFKMQLAKESNPSN